MTGKERIMRTFAGEEVDRTPWVPYIGIHGGQLIHCPADVYMTDERQLMSGLKEVYNTYHPDGMVVAFDLQLEAEALGCQLKWYKDSPPSVISHPLAGHNTVPVYTKQMLKPQTGRLSVILNCARQLKATIGHETAIYGLVCGPLTLAAHLRGEALMMDIVLNEGYVRELLALTTRLTEEMTMHYMAAGADIVAVVDPMVSQISPGHFSKLLDKSFKEIFDVIHSGGKKSAFFVCGNVDKQLCQMCETGPDMISIDEHTDYTEALRIVKEAGIVLAGNLPVTTLMLHGIREEVADYVHHLIQDETPMIVASGCDVPYDTPVENLTVVSECL